MKTQPKAGVLIQPQHCDVEQLMTAWLRAEEIGADSIWTWDHFFPIDGDPHGRHFEAWSVLAAMAVTTSHARIGSLVTCNSYRNPDLLADIARTVDQLSGGRAILGIGAGWSRQDFDEYGYELGDFGARMDYLEESVTRIRRRIALLNPPPKGPLPILIGGDGEGRVLKTVAGCADLWNGWGPVGRWSERNAVLNQWCARLGRDPDSIERTVLMPESETSADVEAYLRAGSEHIIWEARHPVDFAKLAEIIDRVHESVA
jgi:probable F420-dependent oxidoreductase